MALELAKEYITINKILGGNLSQALVEGDIIVPDIKPDILKILQVDGTSMINSYEIQQNKLIVNGSVNFKILYTPDEADLIIKSINVNTSFIHQIDMQMDDEDIKAKLHSDIEHIEFKVINARKVNVKAVVGVECQLISTKEIQMITDISSTEDREEDIQILRRNIIANNLVVEKDEEFIIRDEIEVPVGKPPIKDLLKLDIKVTSKDTKVINDKVVIKGTLNISTLYIGEMDDDRINFMEHEILFTEVLDMQGAEEGMHCELDYSIQDMYYDIKEDLDGDNRIIEMEITLNSETKISKEQSIDIVEDSYSTKFDIEMEKERHEIEQIIDVKDTQLTLKEIITLPEDIPELLQIYNIITKPYVIDTRIEKDKLIAEGVVDTYILYLTNNQENPVYSYKQEISFKEEINIENISTNMDSQIKIEINHCSYNINTASEIELRCLLNVNSTITKTYSIDLIKEVDVMPAEDKELKKGASMVIYFIQKKDTLWEIAKRYQTTVNDIITFNEIEEGASLNVGHQLLIPKKK